METTAPAGEKQRPVAWWRRHDVRKAAVVLMGGVVATACHFLPEWTRPLCAAVGRVMSMVGVG